VRGVFRVVILLEDEVFPVQPIKLHSFEEVILKNAGVELIIHSPIYLAHISHSLRCHAAPNHEGSTPKLYSPTDMLLPQARTRLLPYPSHLKLITPHDRLGFRQVDTSAKRNKTLQTPEYSRVLQSSPEFPKFNYFLLMQVH